MKTKLIDTVKIPEIYLNLIFNADTTGLTDSEIEFYAMWENKIMNDNNIKWFEIDPINLDSYFSWSNPIIPLGCNVIDCNILYLY